MSFTDRSLTPADVAARCQVNAKSVLRAIHRGRLRASRLGESGAYRIRGSDVDAWIEASVVSPPDPKTIRAPTARVPQPPERETDGRLRLTPDMGRH